MPVTTATPDIENLTLTIVAEFAAPIERVWQIYADPRQLEKIWGPPTYPGTVVEHSLTVGGKVLYYMTGPDGQKFAGWWLVTAVDEPHGFSFDDGFANEDFTPAEGQPVSHNTYSFVATDSGTTATYVSRYDSAEALQQVLDMGMVEGATEAINQIDELLAA